MRAPQAVPLNVLASILPSRSFWIMVIMSEFGEGDISLPTIMSPDAVTSADQDATNPEAAVQANQSGCPVLAFAEALKAALAVVPELALSQAVLTFCPAS